MNIHLPIDSKMDFGGGKTAYDYLSRLNITSFYNSDITLLAGPTLVLPETITKAKEKNQVVLRLDGIPEDWRNSGRGWNRLKFAWSQADAVIYQTEFVKNTIGKWLNSYDKKPGRVVYNGVDKSVFSVDGDKYPRLAKKMICAVSSRKDENKRLIEVIERFRYIEEDAHLILVGKVPTYLREFQCGLYGKNNYSIHATDKPKEMAKILRSCDELWWPSFADPSPNVVLEALSCGLEIKYVNDYGGSKELIDKWNEGYDFSIGRMLDGYSQYLEEVLQSKHNH